MFGTIRRHQTWLWVVVATITILSFVIYFNPASKNGGSGSRRGEGNYGTLNGRPITAEQVANAVKEYQLRTFLTTQRWPDTTSVSVQRDAYIRLFLISQMQELGIEPGDKAVAEFAARITGQASLDDFVDRYLKPQGLNGNDFARFLHHELGIEQLISTAGLSGRMVTPQEAEALYRSNHKELATALVYFAASNFLASVTVSPQAVMDYYTNQMNLRYHLRERVQVDYVRFENSNYLAVAAKALTNLDKNVDDIYRQNGTNLFPGVTNEAETKLKLRNLFLNQQASLEARRVAGPFAETLFNLTNGAASLQKLAETNNLKVYSTEPFDNEGPKDLDLPPAFAQIASQLTTNNPFGGPITNGEASFVLALKRRLPSEIEPFDQIKARVTDDYRNEQALLLASLAATNFHTVLTNGLARSNRFDAICAAAQVKPETLPPLSLSSTNLPADLVGHIELNLLQRLAFSTPVGSASQVVNLPDGAIMLYIEKQSPVNEAKVTADLPAFLDRVRQTRQTEAFNEWLGLRVHQDPDFEKTMEDFYRRMQSSAAEQPRSP